MVEPKNSAAKQGGRFRKGQSGNPAGKPRGARHATTLMLERMMADDAKAVVRAVIDKAVRGDMLAARIVVERIAPIRRGRPITLNLPDITGAADVAAAAGAITAAVATGELTPEEALTFGGVLEYQRRAIETGELARRLDLLEGKCDADASE